MKKKTKTNLQNLCSIFNGSVSNNTEIKGKIARFGITGKTFMIFIFCVFVSNTVFTQTIDPDTYTIVPIDGLDLNRTASKRTASQLASYNLDPAYKGFKWDTDDNATQNWWPQGITGIDAGNSQFIVVSWYDHEGNKGARLSFVNITNMDNIKYRHVLLVNENYDKYSFPGIHAGGLFIVGDNLFVPDSRAGKDSIYMFNLNFIRLVPEVDRTHFHDYVYILARTGGESSPIRPSFFSYDFDQQKMLVGTYTDCGDHNNGNPYCTDNSLNTAGWYELGNYNSNSPYYSGFIGKMQGMASKLDPLDPNRTIVWIATSTGSGNYSFLFAFSHYFDENTMPGQVANMGVDFNGYTLTDGLEDLYLEENGQDLWSLTEFPDYIFYEHDRVVFCFDVADIPPPNHRYTQDHFVNNTVPVNTELEYVAATDYVAHADFHKAHSDWIECDNVVPSLINSDRSVFAWIWKDSSVSGDAQMIVGMNTGGTSNTDICNLQINNNEQLAVYDGATTHFTGIGVTNGQWHFVGYTYNNSTNQTLVYVDGVAYADFNNDQHITNYQDRISIGQEFDGSSTSNFFEGTITEVSFWDAVLDPTDISLIMSRTINNVHPKYNNLQAYYPMLVVEGEDNFMAKDYSSHGYFGIASSRYIQEQKDLLEIPGYNSIDHFDVSWIKNQELISTSEILNFIANSESSGTYLLKLTMSDFTVIDTFDLTVNLAVEEIINAQVVEIYPNPATDHIKIVNKDGQMISIGIYNLLGELVYFTEDNKINEINIRTLPTGTYIIRITHPSLTLQQKFIKN